MFIVAGASFATATISVGITELKSEYYAFEIKIFLD